VVVGYVAIGSLVDADDSANMNDSRFVTGLSADSVPAASVYVLYP
jgi:hypothetical protein